MKFALIDRFLKLIPKANGRAFEESQITVDPKIPFLHVFDYFWEQFGIATEEEIVKTSDRLYTAATTTARTAEQTSEIIRRLEIVQ